MITLSVANAIEFVRSRMDELAQEDSEMLVSTEDDRNYDLTVDKLLPEAIKDVCLAVPSSMLEGTLLTEGDWSESFDSEEEETDGVYTIDIDVDILRIVSVQAGDSKVILTNAVTEDSPIGRMQLNKAIRGCPEAPVLVLKGERPGSSNPSYKYYTSATGGFKIFVIYPPTKAQDNSYAISFAIKDKVLNQLMGMVLMTYNEVQKAQYFFTKASV